MQPPTATACKSDKAGLSLAGVIVSCCTGMPQCMKLRNDKPVLAE